MSKPTVDSMIARVVAAWGRQEQTAAAASIAIGDLAHRTVRAGIGSLTCKKSRRTCRAEILDTIAVRLRDAGHKAQPCHVARHIRNAMVARCYGIDHARKQPVGVLRAFARTVRRNGSKEEWSIKPAHEKTSTTIWFRLINGELSPAAAVEEVAMLINAGKPARPPRPKPSAVEQAVKLVASLSAEDQRRLYEALHKRFSTRADVQVVPMERRRAG